jgi:hypothetical protein
MRFGALPNQNSYSHFPQRKIENQSPVFNFIKPNKDYSLGGLIGLTNKSLNPSNVVLDSFVKLHNTISFLIIRNDTILYEKYNGKYTDSSLVSSFSMVKPMISTLIGIAVEEGKLKVQIILLLILPEFKTKRGFEKITIKTFATYLRNKVF